MATSTVAQPLVDELKGLVARLKYTAKPIKDNDAHLVPFCETLEAIFRDGLKQPNSWFGLNKQDYWSWIQPLQSYYFDKKQNPLFGLLVQEIENMKSIRNIQGRGRCFIRGALHQKLISVPIEHLAKSVKLTQYWYGSGSIIGTPELRDSLMECLFHITSLDFDLEYQKASFLDETWTIPVYLHCQLPPIKQLDMDIVCVDKRELIADIEEDSLAFKAGIEKWDILDNLCGTPVNMIKPNTFQIHLIKNSVNFTEVTVVKLNLSNGCPFGPSVQRRSKLMDSKSVEIPSIPSSLHSLNGSRDEYTVEYLGKSQCKASSVTEDLIDLSVMQTLIQITKPERAVLCVEDSVIRLSSSATTLLECSYDKLGICGQSSKHSSCLALFVCNKVLDSSNQTLFTTYICEASTSDLAYTICCRIARGFSEKNSEN